ncbi:MAG TPA: glycosyltransferase family 39 protein, partial [Desulfuromonadales bacterium]|nr:glycosyltransferase family 39 protein [Desulfuromonadales bacterium]
MRRLFSLENGVWFIILFFTALRLFLAPRFGLGVDEAHYSLYGVFPALSYFDHPPLIGWVEALFIHFGGLSEMTSRAPAIFLFVIDSWLLYRLLRRIGANAAEILLALLAANTSFLLFGLSLMFLPDCLLIPLALGIILTAIRLERGKGAGDHALLGLLLGLSGLSKYTAILFVPPLFVYLILKKRLDILRTPRILLTVLPALALIIPVIYWNAQHDFASFTYQFNHVIRHGKHLKVFLQSMGFQFLIYSPFYFGLAIYGLVKSFRARNDYLLLSALMGGSVFVFFVFTSMSAKTLPHWDAVFYFLAIPLGVIFALRSHHRWLRGLAKFSVAFSVGMILLAAGLIVDPVIHFPAGKSPFRDISGFDALVQHGNTLLGKDKTAAKALAVDRWTFGSRLLFYNLKDGYDSQVYVVQDRQDQFRYWQKRSFDQLRGSDLLFLVF